MNYNKSLQHHNLFVKALVLLHAVINVGHQNPKTPRKMPGKPVGLRYLKLLPT